jgi:hypothetical protein
VAPPAAAEYLAPRPPPQENPAVSRDLNVLALVKGEERYVFLFDDDNRTEALRTLGRFASNPDLSFSWYDAAILSQKIRQTAQQEQSSRRFELTQHDNPGE